MPYTIDKAKVNMTGGLGFVRDMQSNYNRNRGLLKKRKSLTENPYAKKEPWPIAANYEQLKQWRLADQARRKKRKRQTLLYLLLTGVLGLLIIYFMTQQS